MMLWLALLALIASPSVPAARRHVVEIRGMAFHPGVLTIAVGDTVVWVNHDIVPHTATAGGGGGGGARGRTWDTGPLQQGQDGRYVARRVGDPPYVCTLHPTMQGRLIIQAEGKP
jgi:plastocyanin